MLQTLVRMDKMAALRRKFAKMGMLAGTTASYMAQMKAEDDKDSIDEDELNVDHDFEADDNDDEEPMSGNPLDTMSDVKLASRCGKSYLSSMFS